MRKLLLAALFSSVSAFGAMAADVVEEAPIIDLPAGFSWTGAYLGGHIGYGWARGGHDYRNDVGFHSENVDIDNSGWLGGVQVGYNHQFNNWVVGIEGDFAWSTADALNNVYTLGGVDVADFAVDTNWLASATARVGYAVDRALFYVKGGVGFTDITIGDTGSNANSPNIEWEGSKTLTGWTLGGGMEYAFRDNWTLKGEYQFYRFDASIPMHNSAGALVRTFDDNIDVHTVKLGLSYKF